MKHNHRRLVNQQLKKLNNSLNAVGAIVAYMLLKQEALIHRTLSVSVLRKKRNNTVYQLKCPQTTWLQSNTCLAIYLKAKPEKHLTYITNIKSAGILLYRIGGDTLLALTKALSQHRKSTMGFSNLTVA